MDSCLQVSKVMAAMVIQHQSYSILHSELQRGFNCSEQIAWRCLLT